MTFEPLAHGARPTADASSHMDDARRAYLRHDAVLAAIPGDELDAVADVVSLDLREPVDEIGKTIGLHEPRAPASAPGARS